MRVERGGRARVDVVPRPGVDEVERVWVVRDRGRTYLTVPRVGVDADSRVVRADLSSAGGECEVIAAGVCSVGACSGRMSMGTIGVFVIVLCAMRRVGMQLLLLQTLAT